MSKVSSSGRKSVCSPGPLKGSSGEMRGRKVRT